MSMGVLGQLLTQEVAGVGRIVDLVTALFHARCDTAQVAGDSAATDRLRSGFAEHTDPAPLPRPG